MKRKKETPAATTHRRKAIRSGRVVRRTLTAPTAAKAVGPITRGMEVFGLSKGQFSLIDLIEHVLSGTGPADVVISTWTAANADLDFALAFLGDGRVRSLRFVVDFSFPSRQPAYCAALRERFGDDAVRLTKTHAKFVTVTNEEWAVVIRSSMNLNENRRLESWEISDDAAMAAFALELVAELFESHAPGAQFAKGPAQNEKEFELLGEQSYFGDGATDRDVRRAGLTTEKGRRL